MSLPEREAKDAIADRAGYWDARLRSPACTDADRASFAEWRDADPAHRATFERLQMFSASLAGALNRADVRGLRDNAISSAGRERSRRLWTAAACIGVLAAGIVLHAPFRSWVGGGADSAERYMTQTGQRSTVTLRDGSSIELNARSQVEVHFSKQRRDLKLVSGQALFRVAKDATRPFVVNAGDRNIVAVGTAFDVRLDDASMRVTLLEGKVNVNRSDAADRAPASLKPGQQLIARQQKGVEPGEGENLILDVNVATATSWREGRVFLEDLPLAEAVAEMNRYSLKQIVVQDSSLESLRVNGMFRAGEQEAFVAALQGYFPLVAERNGDLQIVLQSRP